MVHICTKMAFNARSNQPKKLLQQWKEQKHQISPFWQTFSMRHTRRIQWRVAIFAFDTRSQNKSCSSAHSEQSTALLPHMKFWTSPVSLPPDSTEIIPGLYILTLGRVPDPSFKAAQLFWKYAAHHRQLSLFWPQHQILYLTMLLFSQNEMHIKVLLTVANCKPFVGLACK